MALVKRNGHKYYYKMMRENGKFKRWYGGKGRLAEFLQSLQDQQRQEREEKRSIQAEQEQEHRQARNSGAAVFELVDIGLRASGFARYSRNPWRRRRVMKSLPSPNATKESPDAVRARIRKLADDAYYGSKKAVRQLRELAQAEPVKFASEVGISLSLLGREMLARRTFPNDPKLQRTLLLEMDMLIDELAGDNPSPVRRLLAKNAAFFSGLLSVVSLSTANEGTDKMNESASRRLAWAHNQHLKAMRWYAQIVALENRPARPVRRGKQPAVIDAQFREA